MTTYGPFTDAVPRTLIRSQQANQIIDLLQSATAGTVLMGVGVGVVQMGPLDATVLDGAYEQGEDVTAFVTGAEGVVLNANIGTAAAPSHALGATLKASRTSVATQAELEAWTHNPGYDGCDGQAAILGVASGPHPTETQPVGVMGYAKINSHATLGNRDAVGLYGVGQVEAQGVGTGIGAFILGSTLGPQGTPVGAEIDISNGGSPIAYSPTSFSGGYGIWMNPSGAECAAGIAINNSFGAQFQVGYAVVGGTAGGKTGGASQASFRDDGNAITSYDMRGSHAIGIDTINAALTGGTALRMGHTQTIQARNAANTADWKLLGLASDAVEVGGAAPAVLLYTQGTVKWQMQGSGHLWPGADSTYDIGSGGLKVRQVTAVTLAAAGDVYRRRRYSSGTALTSAAITLSTGWGTARTVTAIAGGDDHFTFRVNTGAGASFAANPTISITFPDGAYAATPLIAVCRQGGNQHAVPHEVVGASASAFSIAWSGTPAASEYYVFSVVVTGR